jgi:hypothetical protein
MKCLVHAQAEEAIMEKEMPADHTLHAKHNKTFSIQ